MMDCNLYAAWYLQFNWTCVLDVSFKSALTVDRLKQPAIWSECKLKYSQRVWDVHIEREIWPIKGEFRGIQYPDTDVFKRLDPRLWNSITTVSNFWRRKKLVLKRKLSKTKIMMSRDLWKENQLKKKTNHHCQFRWCHSGVWGLRKFPLLFVPSFLVSAEGGLKCL